MLPTVSADASLYFVEFARCRTAGSGVTFWSHCRSGRFFRRCAGSDGGHLMATAKTKNSRARRPNLAAMPSAVAASPASPEPPTGAIAPNESAQRENARSLDERERLLKQIEQRDATLAVIASIQQGVAAAQSFDAIVERVGE